MKTTKVVVARLVNTGDFENTRWELTAELEDGDDVYRVAESLAVAIVSMARTEMVRRFPSVDDRKWRNWLDEGDDYPEWEVAADAPEAP